MRHATSLYILSNLNFDLRLLRRKPSPSLPGLVSVLALRCPQLYLWTPIGILSEPCHLRGGCCDHVGGTQRSKPDQLPGIVDSFLRLHEAH